MTPVPILRVARPSDNLDALLRFYEQGLGLTLLYRFEDHEGFDGIMLGGEGAPYHFEFTRSRGHTAGGAPTPDNLLVFYLPNADEWKAPFSECAMRASNPSGRSIPIGIVKAGLSRIQTVTASFFSKQPGHVKSSLPSRPSDA